MKKSLFLFASLCILLGNSCKKDSDIDTAPPPNNPPPRPVLITEVGTPDGQAVSKTINAGGGEITSADGRVKVTIPAGALTSEQNITIQPITNKMGFGFGKAYRITPHINFTKPVSITFSYIDNEIKGTIPELLGIAYQGTNGGWKSVGGVQVDKPNKKITVSTTHFSDWGFFPLVYIQPVQTSVQTNETLDLAVMCTVDDLIVPIPGNTAEDLYAPFVLDASFIKEWFYTGTGSLITNGPKAKYTAPANVPAQNPEAVSVELKMNRPGAFFLVSNITVLNQFHIAYMQVNETDVNVPGIPPVSSRLILYGNFGNDPGETKRSVKISSFAQKVTMWTPRIIMCDIPQTGVASSGMVEVTSNNITTSKVLNEWTVQFTYEKIESPGGALTRKVKLFVRIRGVAGSFIPPDLQSMMEYSDINKASKATIDMGTSSFTNQVRMETCGAYTVKWDPVSTEVQRVHYSSSANGISGRLYYVPGGFKLKLKMRTADILTSTRTFAPCTGMTTTQVVNEPINLLHMEDKEIDLKLIGNTLVAPIEAGLLPTVYGTEVAPGMFFDVVDVNPEALFTKLNWVQAPAKFE